jgi:hypothetical protein
MPQAAAPELLPLPVIFIFIGIAVVIYGAGRRMISKHPVRLKKRGSGGI